MAAEGQTSQMSPEEILEFWRDQAREHGQSHAASWSDRHAMELEIRELGARLEDGDKVLDIGCASGFSTLRLARQHRITVRGLDFAPEMIDQARRALESAGPSLESELEFDTGDILDLAEPSDHYDKAVVTRVVINLPSWERQAQALREAIRVVKPGGLLLLSEACLQGWRNLNRFREEWGLGPIPMPPFNNYLDVDAVVEELTPSARLLELANFSSSYYVGTRLLKPLLAQASQAPIDPADPDTDWNRWCSMLPPAGDYGVQVLFVFQKHQA